LLGVHVHQHYAVHACFAHIRVSLAGNASGVVFTLQFGYIRIWSMFIPAPKSPES
jgi:hypothetical protein